MKCPLCRKRLHYDSYFKWYYCKVDVLFSGRDKPLPCLSYHYIADTVSKEEFIDAPPFRVVIWEEATSVAIYNGEIGAQFKHLLRLPIIRAEDAPALVDRLQSLIPFI